MIPQGCCTVDWYRSASYLVDIFFFAFPYLTVVSYPLPFYSLVYVTHISFHQSTKMFHFIYAFHFKINYKIELQIYSYIKIYYAHRSPLTWYFRHLSILLFSYSIHPSKLPLNTSSLPISTPIFYSMVKITLHPELSEENVLQAHIT